MKCPECGHSFLPDLKEKQSIVGASSRRKGANFERGLAKKLKKWWPGNYEFKRTPQSGGSALKEGFDMAGDICTNAPDFRYHIEAKNSPGSFKGFHQFFTADKFKVWEWWEQAIKDCPEHRTPLLIVNRFDQPTWCIFIMDGFIGVHMIERLHQLNIPYLMFDHRADTGEGYVHQKPSTIIWQLNDMLDSDPEYWK